MYCAVYIYILLCNVCCEYMVYREVIDTEQIHAVHCAVYIYIYILLCNVFCEYMVYIEKYSSRYLTDFWLTCITWWMIICLLYIICTIYTGEYVRIYVYTAFSSIKSYVYTLNILESMYISLVFSAIESYVYLVHICIVHILESTHI